jgi:hypothetical protein
MEELGYELYRKGQILSYLWGTLVVVVVVLGAINTMPIFAIIPVLSALRRPSLTISVRMTRGGPEAGRLTHYSKGGDLVSTKSSFPSLPFPASGLGLLVKDNEDRWCSP